MSGTTTITNPPNAASLIVAWHDFLVAYHNYKNKTVGVYDAVTAAVNFVSAATAFVPEGIQKKIAVAIIAGGANSFYADRIVFNDAVAGSDEQKSAFLGMTMDVATVLGGVGTALKAAPLIEAAAWLGGAAAVAKFTLDVGIAYRDFLQKFEDAFMAGTLEDFKLYQDLGASSSITNTIFLPSNPILLAGTGLTGPVPSSASAAKPVGNVQAVSVYASPGSSVRIALSGSGSYVASTGANLLSFDGGSITLTIPEGQDYVTFALIDTSTTNQVDTPLLKASVTDADGNVVTSNDLTITFDNPAPGDTSAPVTPPATPVLPAGVADFTIVGDFEPMNFGTAEAPQYHYDPLGNLITDPTKPSPDRADVLRGSGGNDFIDALGGNNYVDGTYGGNDTIYASDGNNTIYTSNGANTVNVENGNNTVVGGTGNDTIVAGSGNNLVLGGSGDNAINIGDGDNTLTSGNGNDTIKAGKGNNNVNAGDGKNVINMGDGKNTISSGNGDDYITVGKGDNEITNGDGNDTIKLGNGNNTVTGGDGNNTITGGTGNDLIKLGNGDNILKGGKGQDVIIVGNGTNLIYADKRVDLATAFTQQHTISKTNERGALIAVRDGNNTIIGGGGDDAIFTGVGNNTIVCGPGSITVIGGVEVAWASRDWSVTVNTSDSGFTHYFFDGVDATSAPFSGGPEYSAGTWNSVPVGLGNDTIFGGTGNSSYLLSNGNNYLDAGGGNDTIGCGTGYSTIFGGTGNDTIFGGGGNNYINLESGNDYVAAYGGNNTIIGGSGNSTIFSGKGPDWANSESTANNYIYGGSGNAVIYGSAGNDTLIGGTGNATIYGGNGNEYIVAGDGDVSIVGGNGNDTIYAGIGKDTIYAGTGNTWIYGGSGTDYIVGGAGVEVISAGDGGTLDAPTVVYAGSGTNTLYGGAGVGQLVGGTGSDILIAGTGTTTLQGGSGTEVMYSSIGNATLRAGSGNDTLYGGGGTDLLIGDSGNTLFVAGSGNETIYGGTGTNTYQFNSDFGSVELANSKPSDTFQFGPGISVSDLTISATFSSNGGGALLIQSATGGSLILGNGLSGAISQFHFSSGEVLTLAQLLAQADVVSTTLSGSSGDLTFSGGGGEILTGGSGNDSLFAANGGNTLTAGSGDQKLYSISGHDSLVGGSGNDTLISQGGNTTLVAGSGAMTLVGSAGNDTFVVNKASDVVIAQAGTSNNTIVSSIDYILPANVQNLTLTGDANLTAIGNNLNNVLTANSGNDTLISGSGVTTLIGGSGNDTFVINNSSDVIIALPASGSDSVLSSVSFTLPDNVNILTLTGSADLSAAANSGNNIITGNAGNDTLTAGSGNDTLVAGSGLATMIGGTGNVTFVVNNVADVIHAQSTGSNTNTVVSSTNYSLEDVANVQNLTLVGNAALTAVGNALDNVIHGNDGNDTLIAGSGNDTLIGGGGNTVFEVDLGVTSTVIQAGSEYDMVSFGAGITLADLNVTGTLNSLGEPVLEIDIGDSGRVSIIGGLSDSIDQFNVDGTFYTLKELLLATATHSNDVAGVNGEFKFSAVAGDVLTGTGGNDTLAAYGANATLIGGGGATTFLVNDTSEVVIEAHATANDTILASVNYVLPENIQNLTLVGQNNLVATGNDLANIITANNGDDTLIAGSGIATLIGGDGYDTFVVNNSADVVIAQSGVVKSSVSYITPQNIAKLILTGTADLMATGNDQTNYIYANSGNDTLIAGSGTTVFYGGKGNDTFVVNSVDDVVEADAGAASNTVMTSVSYVAPAFVQNLVGTGSADIMLSANWGSNVTVTANSGNDTLRGGTGSGTLVGGSGLDTFDFNGGGTYTAIKATAQSAIVQLDPGIDFADLTTTQSGNDLILSVDGFKTFTLKDYFLDAGNWSIRDNLGHIATADALLTATAEAQSDQLAFLKKQFFAQSKLAETQYLIRVGYTQQADGSWYYHPYTLDTQVLGWTSTTTTNYSTEILNLDSGHVTVSSTTTHTTTSRWSMGLHTLSINDYGATIQDLTTDSNESSISATYYHDTFTSTPVWLKVGWTKTGSNSITEGTPPSTSMLLGGFSGISYSGYYPPIVSGGNAYWSSNWSSTTFEYYTGSLEGSLADSMLTSPGSYSTTGSKPQVVADIYNHSQETLYLEQLNVGEGQHTVYGSENTVITAGSSDSLIYAYQGFVDAGSGNDTIYGASVVYGGSGNDTIYGATDYWAGGSIHGSEIVYGGSGNELIVNVPKVMVGSGNETIFGSGSGIISIDPTKNDYDLVGNVGTPSYALESKFIDDYYKSLGIEDGVTRYEGGGEYQSWNWSSYLTDQTIGWYLAAYGNNMSLEEALSTGFVKYIDPLPSLVVIGDGLISPSPYYADSHTPISATFGANDFATLAPYFDSGTFPVETVTFGLGLSVSDLAFSWGQVETALSGVSTDRQHPYTTLDLKWGVGHEVDIIIPHLNDYLGSGVQEFVFADGTHLNMAQMIALAPPAPTFDPEIFRFARGMGEVILPTYAEQVVFAAGINFADLSLSVSGSDLIIADGGDKLVIANGAVDPVTALDNISFSFSDSSTMGYLDDGSGALDFVQFDSHGNVIGDLWLHSDGSSGFDIYDPVTGASSGRTLFADLTTSTYIDDGQGNRTTAQYDSSGHKTGDEWTKSDGSSGFDSYDVLTGASSGTTTYLDGSSTSYLDDGHGDVTTVQYDTQGKYLGDVWQRANGSHGSDNYLIDTGRANGSFTLTGGASLDWSSGLSSSGNLITSQVTSDVLTGLAGSDSLFGFGNNDTLSGGPGGEYIYGSGNGDILISGAGDDLLIGTGNNDTFVFNLGDGVDTIIAAGDDDVLQFGAGITPDMIHLDLGSLLLHIGSSGDAIHIEGFDPNNAEITGAIPVFKFANGDSLSYEQILAKGFDLNGSAGNDTLVGTNVNDRITGLAGDDTLIGGAGSDTYYFNLGDGHDTIIETLNASDLNSVVFGFEHATHTLQTSATGDNGYDLTITIQDTGDTLTLKDWFNPALGKTIQAFQFADGVTLNQDQITDTTASPTNHPPETAADIAAVTEDSLILVSGNVLANDSDIDPGTTLQVSNPGTYTGAYGSLALNTNGSYTYTLNSASSAVQSLGAGTIVNDVFNYSASDGSSSTPSTLTVSITGSNDAPSLSLPIADQTVGEGIGFNYVIPTNTFSDIDTGSVLSYSAHLSDGSTLPSWLSFDPTTRSFSGTPSHSDIGDIDIQVQASDGSLATTDTFKLSITTAIVGSGYSDTLTGTDFADYIVGGAGDDVINGGGGNDVIDGGIGYDVMNGGAGNDTFIVNGAATDDGWSFDTYNGGEGSDTILGGTGNDTIRVNHLDASNSIEFIDGGAGTNQIAGTVWGDVIDLSSITVSNIAVIAGDRGDDTIIGTAGNDVIDGGSGADVLNGGAGNDTFLVNGDSADDNWGFDTFNGGTGSDTVLGGAGNDTIRVHQLSTANSIEFIDGGAGTNIIAGTVWGDVIDLSSITISNIAVIAGDRGDDTIIGTAGNDVIDGGSGSDVLNGGAGNDTFLVNGDSADDNWGFDTFNGGTGSDTVLGGAGNDTLRVHQLSSANSIEFIDGGAGTNQIAGTVYSDVIDLSSINVSNIGVIAGDRGDDTIIGTAGNDVIDGGSGSDVLNGGAGNDTFLVNGDSADDNWGFDSFNGGTGSDTILGGAGNDTIRVASLTASNSIEFIDGGAGTNQIAGTVWGDVIDLSSITVSNIALISGDRGDDTITGTAGNDYIDGGQDSDILNGGGGIDVLQGGEGNDQLTGNGLLKGDSGNDQLIGGTSNSLFIGGTGNDVINMGSGQDILAFNRGDGVDQISLSSNQDTLSLGGGIRNTDLTLRKSSNDLILDTGNGESLVLQDWYGSTPHPTVLTLQMIEEASIDYAPGGSNTLTDNKVEQFNLAGLVTQFDQARSTDPSLSSWAVSNALMDFYLGGSDTQAMGGDLAYQYGKTNNLSSIGITAAQAMLTSPQFGQANQAINQVGLADGNVRLSA